MGLGGQMNPMDEVSIWRLHATSGKAYQCLQGGHPMGVERWGLGACTFSGWNGTANVQWSTGPMGIGVGCNWVCCYG